MKKMLRMKQRMVSLFIPVLTLLAGSLHAQEDSIKIHQVNVHIIMNGKQTARYFTRNQKTLTMDEQLIREVNFNDSTKQIEDYTFYFYKDGKLSSEETYDKNDSMLQIIKHAYNEGGQKAETIRMAMVSGKSVQTARTVFTYHNNGNILVIKEYTAGKKPYRIKTCTYSSGRLVKEKSKTKNPQDNIILRIVDYQYETDGKPMTIGILEKNKEKEIHTMTESYRYDDKGKLEKIEIRDTKNEMLLVKNYVYYPGGALYRYYEQDREGNMLCYHTYAYRKHRINLGTQKSYFDRP